MEQMREYIVENKEKILSLTNDSNNKFKEDKRVDYPLEDRNSSCVLAPESTTRQIKGLPLEVREYFYTNLNLSLLKNYEIHHEQNDKCLTEEDISNIVKKIEYYILCKADTPSEYKTLILEKIKNSEKSTAENKLYEDVIHPIHKNLEPKDEILSNTNNTTEPHSLLRQKLSDDKYTMGEEIHSEQNSIHSSSESFDRMLSETFQTAEEMSFVEDDSVDVSNVLKSTIENESQRSEISNEKICEHINEELDIVAKDKPIFNIIVPIIRKYYLTHYIPTDACFGKILLKLYIELKNSDVKDENEMKALIVEIIETKRFLHDHCLAM